MGGGGGGERYCMLHMSDRKQLAPHVPPNTSMRLPVHTAPWALRPEGSAVPAGASSVHSRESRSKDHAFADCLMSRLLPPKMRMLFGATESFFPVQTALGWRRSSSLPSVGPPAGLKSESRCHGSMTVIEFSRCLSQWAKFGASLFQKYIFTF